MGPIKCGERLDTQEAIHLPTGWLKEQRKILYTLTGGLRRDPVSNGCEKMETGGQGEKEVEENDDFSKAVVSTKHFLY